MMNNDSYHDRSRMVSDPTRGESAQRDLVLIYATAVPHQLQHWLAKHDMQMLVRSGATVDPNEVRSSGARFVILDLDEMAPEHPPIETVRHLRTHIPEARLLLVTSSADPSFSRRLVEAGASGVVIKHPYVADLVFALQAAKENRRYVSGQMTDRERAAAQITPREHEVLTLMANGHSNQSIGEGLSISVKTVEAHRARLFKKLGATNVAQAVLLAIRSGLVMP